MPGEVPKQITAQVAGYADECIIRDPNGEPLTVEGRSLPGSATIGNRALPFNMSVELEISLTNITYLERFPWPAQRRLARVYDSPGCSGGE